jgi:hypothetical protein
MTTSTLDRPSAVMLGLYSVALLLSALHSCPLPLQGYLYIFSSCMVFHQSLVASTRVVRVCFKVKMADAHSYTHHHALLTSCVQFVHAPGGALW